MPDWQGPVTQTWTTVTSSQRGWGPLGWSQLGPRESGSKVLQFRHCGDDGMPKGRDYRCCLPRLLIAAGAVDIIALHLLPTLGGLLWHSQR